MMRNGPVLIGVDGGATEVKGHAVDCEKLSAAAGFGLRGEHAARTYERRADFCPVPVAEQVGQQRGGCVELSECEREQGALWVRAAAEVICEVARQCGGGRVLVGIGMPGLKTADRRGIVVINNGPRIPDYLDQLERLLRGQGVELATPIASLGSDADYCGLGEEYAAEGLFRDVRNAYYVGCGTGIADALKLRGRLVPFDAVKGWMLKSWQIPSRSGPVFERLVSAASLNRVYRELAGDANESIFPERAAAAGEPRAREWMSVAAGHLAELIFERLWTIKNGRAEVSERGEVYMRLDPRHEFRGTVLERVVIGQRVGQIYGEAAYKTIFGDQLDAALANGIAGCGDAELMERYLAPGSVPTLRPGVVKASRLRAAPALGAAVAAAAARPSAESR